MPPDANDVEFRHHVLQFLFCLKEKTDTRRLGLPTIGVELVNKSKKKGIDLGLNQGPSV